MKRRAVTLLAALGTLGIGSALAAGGAGVVPGYLDAALGGGFPVAAFLLAAPALAVAALLRSQDLPARIVLVLAAVVVLNVLVAEAMLVMNTYFTNAPLASAWSVPGGVVAVAVISALMWFVAGIGGAGPGVSDGPEMTRGQR